MKTRLNILLENNVIDQSVYDETLEILDQIIIPKGLNECDATVVLLTHLAMATTRIKNDDVVAPMDGAIKEEIMKHPSITEVNGLVEEILSKYSTQYPLSEKDYVMLHVCNVINERGE